MVVAHCGGGVSALAVAGTKYTFLVEKAKYPATGYVKRPHSGVFIGGFALLPHAPLTPQRLQGAATGKSGYQPSADATSLVLYAHVLRAHRF